MKKLLLYYFLIFSPVAVMFYYRDEAGNHLFWFLMGYLVYRGFLDYYRLKSLGVVDSSDRWKFFTSLWTSRYFRELYFKK